MWITRCLLPRQRGEIRWDVEPDLVVGNRELHHDRQFQVWAAHERRQFPNRLWRQFHHPVRVLAQLVLRPLAHGPELVASVVGIAEGGTLASIEVAALRLVES
jgi:hypothetical protein